MRIPRKIELGKLPITFVGAYNPMKHYRMKSAIEDGPTLFVDLEWPQPEFQVQKSLELHLGVWGPFRNEKLYSNTVRPHIDIYLPIEAVIELLTDHAEQLFNFYGTCKKLNFKQDEIKFFARKKLLEVIS